MRAARKVGHREDRADRGGANRACDERRESGLSLFPVFLKLTDRPCLVVGAGRVGEPKIESLLAAGAAVKVVAPEATGAVAQWARAGKIDWQARRFEPSDLEGVFLVVVATSSRELNDSVYREAQARGVLCNVVDDPPHCDFYYPAVVNRGQLQIAISTNGQSPASGATPAPGPRAAVRTRIRGLDRSAGRERQRLFTLPLNSEERRRILHGLVTKERFEEFVSGKAV